MEPHEMTWRDWLAGFASFFGAFGIVAAVNVSLLVYLFSECLCNQPIFAVGPCRNEWACNLLMGFGVAQLVYVVPLGVLFRWKGWRAALAGLVTAAALTVLLSFGCAGLV